ncbi:hypothetical protein ALI144C_32910 [Actinosynnema sp. ALI-1.44]|uniref:hypothetical protein n=1 Tax=Actinosynnema sp. ALI-1.44 TaxID=1933779 RepID=UPI00097BC3C6|nr:hypothetical protein [Actinosynnema sp. ALI-1.44]ONI76927.1 hypothetical protein ALI144C_32910 [Actinosynnema sp. ALI-1.44]
MDVRYSTNPAQARGFDTAQPHRHHLVEDVPSRLEPTGSPRTDHFCERREPAAFCVDGRGAVIYDGTAYELERGDLVHIGRGRYIDDMDHAAMTDPR